MSFPAEYANQLLALLGGSGVIISISSVWTAINYHRMRQLLERIEANTRREEI